MWRMEEEEDGDGEMEMEEGKKGEEIVTESFGGHRRQWKPEVTGRGQ